MKAETLTSCCWKMMPDEWRKEGKRAELHGLFLLLQLFFSLDIKMITLSAQKSQKGEFINDIVNINARPW